MRAGIFLLLLVFNSQQAMAQSSDPEWPCIQVLVPEIVTAVMWPEFIPDEQLGKWKNDPELTRVVQELGAVDEFTDAERQRIEEFAESIAEESRLETLNMVAEGIVSTANKRRDKYISGIKKYTRQQISIANQIETVLNQLAELEQNEGGQNSSDEINNSRAEIEETLAWHQRVYDQRERAIQSLCDVPVELEEKLSSVVRELAQYLP